MELSPDFRDLLQAFDDADVRYLVVGGYAVGFHARPRYTKDIDVWIGDAPDNVERAREALTRFGAPPVVVDSVGAGAREDVVWMGAPPTRIDLVVWIPGVEFDAAWSDRVVADWDGVRVSLIGLEQLIAAKEASGRDQDRLDAAALRRVRSISRG